jgi:FemAB family.
MSREDYPGFRFEDRQARFIDLSRTPEDLWRDVKDGARYSIKKAEKNGVTLSMAANETDVDAFYSILESTLKRGGGKVLSCGVLYGAVEAFFRPRMGGDIVR